VACIDRITYQPVLKGAHLTDLNETRISPLELVDESTVSVEAGPWKIVTIELEATLSPSL
jgi:hypothetical protein